MDNNRVKSIEERIKLLEQQVRQLTAVNRGIDSTTHGWDGSCLVLGKLTVQDSIEATGNISSAGNLIVGGITQEDWTAPTLLNSWADFGSGYETAGYMKDSQGFVHLRGLINAGTTSTGDDFFVLPAGYRPAATEKFIVACNNAYGVIQVNSSGEVEVDTISSNVWVSLSGVTFKVA